jgi:hypothetical protein
MNRKTDMQIYMSDRFGKAYGKAIFCLQGLAEGAVHDFVNILRSDPKKVLHNYDRLAHLPSSVIEIPISGGQRLLAQYSENHLLLLDMGDHDVVRRYSISKLNLDLRKNRPASKLFWPESKSKFFVRYPDKTQRIQYKEEVTAVWLYYLEKDQTTVFENIVNAIISENNRPHFIIGGPGTGKTCIILNILKFFADSEFKVGIVISDNLIAYINSATQIDISQYSDNVDSHQPLDLLLVDDPENIRQILQKSNISEVGTIVAAFDPLQVRSDLTDNELEEILSDFNVCLHVLRKCYRQKENVGKTTKHIVDIVEASTPFLRQDKIDDFRQNREQLSRLSNDLIFINPHGYSEHYPDATINDVQVEVNNILRNEWLMWKHWPSLLILLHDCELTKDTYDVLSPLMRKNNVKILNFDKIEEVKGLEFQHVFIFINKVLYEELHNGFTGSGQKTYHSRRLYRIPFSRAKDSLVTFAIEHSR